MENNNPNVDNIKIDENVSQTDTSLKKETSNTGGLNQIAGAILIVGLFISGAILLKGSRPATDYNIGSKTETNTDNSQKTSIRPISPDEHISFIEPNNPKIYIVEYSDTECPFCKMFHQTMQQIVTNNHGQVAWVYRHYPIGSLHPKAFHEAEATECAWEQGQNETFWQYTNEIYKRTESNNKLPVEELPKIARDIGLDMNTFNACLTSSKYADKIEADIMDGQKAGVAGTPNSFIVKDGVVIDIIAGAEGYNTLQEKISTLLK